MDESGIVEDARLDLEAGAAKKRLPLPGWVLGLARRVWDLLESLFEVCEHAHAACGKGSVAVAATRPRNSLHGGNGFSSTLFSRC